MNHAINIKQILIIVQDEVRCAKKLLDRLKMEHEALTKHDVDDIHLAAMDKKLLISDLERLATKQGEILRDAGIDPEQTDLNALFNRPGQEKIQQHWQELSSLLSQCRQQNRVNGGIIKISQNFTQQSLDILRGVPSLSKLYNPKGKTDTIAGKRQLAQA